MIPVLVDFLERGFDGVRFSFFVISAAPREVIQSALEGIVPPDRVFGTELDYDTSLMSRGFLFNNPNAKSTCGCGLSFNA